MIIIMDKYKDIEIILKSLEVLEYGKEVTEMAMDGHIRGVSSKNIVPISMILETMDKLFG